MTKYQHHILTNDGVMIIFDNKTVSVTKEMAYFKEAMDCLNNHDTARLHEIINPKIRIEQHTGFVIKGETVFIEQQPVPPRLSDIIIKFVDQRLPVLPIIKFWQNIRDNPSPAAAKEELFDFLQHNSIALTEDGCFLAYKKIRQDYTDCWTGKILNKPKTFVSMPRKDVCADRSICCAPGLHVAAWHYFKSCYSDNSTYRTIEVKVNPKDVVSVPNEYGFAKMRVCKYYVTREINKPNNVVLKKTTKSAPKKTAAKDKAESSNVLKVGNRGRIFIQKRFLSAIDAAPGDKVYVNVVGKTLHVSKTNKIGICYHVTDEGNLKIGASVLEMAKLSSRTRVNINIVKKSLVIS